MRPMTALGCGAIAAVLATAIGSGTPPAQEMATRPQAAPTAAVSVRGDWIVVTMAPDGALGMATAATAGQAIAQAIRNCSSMSPARIGCGAQSQAVRAGWVLAMRCGTANIIVAEQLLSDAARAAAAREAALRRLYAPDLPPCRRVLTVDPRGGIGMTGW